MSNHALWPYFSPSYLHLGVDCFYLVPLLFLAHTSSRLTVSKCIQQFVCNIMQTIDSFYLVRDPEIEILCAFQIFSGHYTWYY
jgi:predicted glycoside hydrolase/deacetylase ChbG (UPF0249 family)